MLIVCVDVNEDEDNCKSFDNSVVVLPVCLFYLFPLLHSGKYLYCPHDNNLMVPVLSVLAAKASFVVLSCSLSSV